MQRLLLVLVSIAITACGGPPPPPSGPAWWCVPALDGVGGACFRQRDQCEHHRGKALAHARDPAATISDCTPEDVAYCFTSTIIKTGRSVETCGADLEACTLRRDVAVPVPDTGLVHSECRAIR
jgi:hypothetical protein